MKLVPSLSRRTSESSGTSIPLYHTDYYNDFSYKEFEQVTPQERLKEIEAWAKDTYSPLSEAGLRVKDAQWLIERVKQLEGALREYARNPISIAGSHADHIERLIEEEGCKLARYALSTDPKPE